MSPIVVKVNEFLEGGYHNKKRRGYELRVHLRNAGFPECIRGKTSGFYIDPESNRMGEEEGEYRISWHIFPSGRPDKEEELKQLRACADSLAPYYWVHIEHKFRPTPVLRVINGLTWIR